MSLPVPPTRLSAANVPRSDGDAGGGGGDGGAPELSPESSPGPSLGARPSSGPLTAAPPSGELPWGGTSSSDECVLCEGPLRLFPDLRLVAQVLAVQAAEDPAAVDPDCRRPGDIRA